MCINSDECLQSSEWTVTTPFSTVTKCTSVTVTNWMDSGMVTERIC